MTIGRDTGSGRAAGLVAVGLCLAAVACRQPAVGERVSAAAPAEGPRLVIEHAGLDLHGHAVATFSVTQEGVPLLRDEVLGLAPRFTLARLTDHPADPQRAWESLVLTGKRVVPALRPGGPDDPNVLANVRQPGSEAPSSLVDLGEGRFRYVFATALDALDPHETIRVGAWLGGVEHASLLTSSTYDFSPSGVAVEARDTVLDANCADCHGAAVVAHHDHGPRAGVRLCVTCHTWQNADPLTFDPAALYTSAATATAAYPNPLELGRMLHRIHRGKDLPTLYQSTWNPAFAPTPWDPASPPTTVFAPFVQQKPGSPVRNPIAGRKYSIVAEDGHEVVFARSIQLPTVDASTGATMLLAAGGLFPRDLRDCAACHRDAAQGWVVKYGITRRTCSGCHPEVWFAASSPALDRSRFPHTAGPQADDARCVECHVTGTREPSVLVEDAHVPPARSPRYNQPYVEIVRVEDLRPGLRPKVTFRLWDRVGPIAPSPSAPQPAFEPEWESSSFVPRRFDPVAFTTVAATLQLKIIGPVETDFAGPTGVQLTSGLHQGNPDPTTLTTSSDSDEYVYTFSSSLPVGFSGTLLVGVEGRRFFTPASQNPWNATKKAFLWPYTGETVNETPENVWVYVSSTSGVWTRAGGSPGANPRRAIVEMQKCLRCHDRIEFHSGQRHDAGWCITCHTPDATDLAQRLQPTTAGRRYPNGPVNIGATYDGVEERSTHFKMNMHRMHTGSRKGVATLEAIRPYALYFSKAYFFDTGGFPGPLENCTVCHVGKSYLIEAIPLGAPPTRGNETAATWHWSGNGVRGTQQASGGDAGGAALLHPDDEPSIPPIQASCTGCHASGATFAHVEAKTVGGVETCDQCHSKGPLSVEVVHGLAPPSGGASASFSSIVAEILVPRCATAACHGAGATPPILDASSAYGQLVGKQSGQSTLLHVKPYEPENSYLVHKLRGTAGSVGGSLGTIMPTDGALPPADLAAIEAWIANGALND